MPRKGDLLLGDALPNATELPLGPLGGEEESAPAAFNPYYYHVQGNNKVALPSRDYYVCALHRLHGIMETNAIARVRYFDDNTQELGNLDGNASFATSAACVPKSKFFNESLSTRPRIARCCRCTRATPTPFTPARAAWRSTNGKGDLQRHWLERQGEQLSFAHLHKLVDLFVKWLSSHDLGVNSLATSFIKHANCALDSQTLLTLNHCLSRALPIESVSMGSVRSAHTYSFCQWLIDSFASHFGGSRLLFDYYAWRPGGAAKPGRRDTKPEDK